MGKGSLVFWSMVLALCAAVFLSRAIFAIAETTWSLGWIAGLIALLYFVFLLEGLQTAATQLLAADADSLHRFVDESRALKDTERRRIKKLVGKLRDEETAFKSGRELLAITAIVCIALLFQSLPFDPTGASVAALLGSLAGDARAQWEQPVALAIADMLLGSVFVLVLGHVATAIVVSALLPFWVSQLLPQVLAERRGIGFTLLWLAPHLARASIRLGRLRIGEPSVKLSTVIAKALELDEEERIVVGSTQLLERLESYFGLVVTKRTIDIDASGCVVTETWTIRFSARRREVRQLIRIPVTHVRLRRWEARLPDGVQAGRLIKMMLITYEELQRTSVESSDTMRHDAGDDPAGDAQPNGKGNHLARRQVGEELVFLLEAPLQESLPRKGRISEEVDLELTYEMPALDCDLDDAETFSFDIAKPTELIEISLRARGGQFIREPAIRFVQADEMNILSRPDEVLSVQPSVDPDGSGYKVRVEHPPFGSRMLLSLDLRDHA